mmetsp:Transcript_89826/g.290229  ORF Transcript_89826/g.290229 Transcript_89826/m.290229 type:complete len:101 (-) Transcript_89826:35-337(-)
MSDCGHRQSQGWVHHCVPEETLGYSCYEQYQNHFVWVQMMENCDPTGVFKWLPATTTLAPRDMAAQSSPDRIGISGARALRGGWTLVSPALTVVVASLRL